MREEVESAHELNSREGMSKVSKSSTLLELSLKKLLGMENT